jgi:hypothetical protein
MSRVGRGQPMVATRTRGSTPEEVEPQVEPLPSRHLFAITSILSSCISQRLFLILNTA